VLKLCIIYYGLAALDILKMSTEETLVPEHNSKGKVTGWVSVPHRKGSAKTTPTPAPAMRTRHTSRTDGLPPPPRPDPKGPEHGAAKVATPPGPNGPEHGAVKEHQKNFNLDENPCDKCGNNDRRLAVCMDCKSRLCSPCGNFQVDLLDCLDKYPGLSFACTTCYDKPKPTEVPIPAPRVAEELSSESLKKMIQEIVTLSMTTIVADVKNQVNEVVATGKTHLQQSYADVTRVTGTITSMVDNKLPKDATPVQTARHQAEIIGSVDEYLDRDGRKRNLILYGVAEQTTGSREERMRKDGEAFADLTKEEFKLNVKITKAIRLGRKVGDRPRILLVTLEDPEEKRDILRRSKDLRRSTTRRNVYIQSDETPKERATSRELRAVLKARRDAGENNIVILNGAIVKVATRGRHHAHPPRRAQETRQVVTQATPQAEPQVPPPGGHCSPHGSSPPGRRPGLTAGAGY
jgi:hypothetical protein